MASPTLDRARVLFLEALELAGRSKATLALYDRNLKELQDRLSANFEPRRLEEVEGSHIKGFLLHLV